MLKLNKSVSVAFNTGPTINKLWKLIIVTSKNYNFRYGTNNKHKDDYNRCNKAILKR